MSINEWYLVDHEELGEPPQGAEDHDMDLHCEKYRRITPEMREQERIAERRRNGLYFDEAVYDAQKRLVDMIPKNNLRVPYKWFFDDGDAEKVSKAAARVHDIGVNRLSTTSLTRSLGMFLDVVSKHRGLRMKNKGDPPHMSLQEHRNRHWQAVIDESSFARDFSQGLVRHVTLMLVGAHLAFAESKGSWNRNNGLNDKIIKVSEWLEENDPEDVRSFESSQPERQKVNAPKQVTGKTKRAHNSRKRKAAIEGPDVIARFKRRQTNAPSPARPDRTKSSTPSPRTDLKLPPLPLPSLDGEVELPERPAGSKGRKRVWNERV